MIIRNTYQTKFRSIKMDINYFERAYTYSSVIWNLSIMLLKLLKTFTIQKH